MSLNPFLNRAQDWRPFEPVLLDFLRSHHVQLADGGGTAFFEAVVHRDPDDTIAVWISIEGLARHLANEVLR
jgi:hypothetical protein